MHKILALSIITAIGIAAIGGSIALYSAPTPDAFPTPAPDTVFVDSANEIASLGDIFLATTTPEPTETTVADTTTAKPISKPSVKPQAQIESTPTPAPTSSPTPQQTVSASQVVTLINAERSRTDVPPLAINPLLNKSAQIVSDHHVELKYTGHVAPDGKESFFSVKQVGYTYAAIGENLAYMTPGLSAAAVVSEWMKSASHKETLLSRDFLEAGVGVTWGPVTIDGTTYAYIVAMHFGRQL